MKKHYQIVNGNIVFNVQDEEKVLEELNDALNRAFGNQFTAETWEEYLEPGDSSCTSEPYTVLCISDSEGTCVNYAAKAPVLVNVDGKFCHYWDFELSTKTITDVFDDEFENVVDNLEDMVIKTIEAFV